MAEIDRFTTWQAAFLELARRLEKQKPLTGPGSRLEQTGRGIRISAAPDAGGETYRGYFRIDGRCEADGCALTVTDGAAAENTETPAAGPAGFALINDQLLELPGAELATELAAGAVYAGFELLTSGAVQFTSYRIEAESPANADRFVYFLLATFHREGDCLSVVQQHHGRIYGWIFHECESEEA